MLRQCAVRGLRRRRAAAAAISALVGSLLWAPLGAAASTHDSYICRTVVDDKLKEIGVGPDDIRDIAVVANRSGGEAKRVIGYSAWVALKACKGSVVIDLSLMCTVRQTYTHGDCRIGGVKR